MWSKRLLSLPAALVLTGLLAAPGARADFLPAREQILSDMVLANNYFTNKWPTPGCSNCLPGNRPSNIWTRGTYFEGALALYRINRAPEIQDYAVRWGTFHDWALRYGDTDPDPNSQCAPQSYIELYQFDPARTNRLTHAIRNANYWIGTTNLNRLTFVDTIHMSLPLFAKLAALTGNPRYAERMYDCFHYIKSVHGRSNGLYNTTDHLWWRDTNYLADYKAADGTTQKCYWSRGNGWAFAALARVMDVLPASDSHYAEYRQTFQQMAAALKAVQRPDGFWNVNLGYAKDYPGPETSGTAMFTYGLAWGINHGHLDPQTYLPTVIAGWNALATRALHHTTNANNGFLGCVQGTGDQPASGQPVTYDSVPDFEDYALGAFLLAGSQVYALSALPAILKSEFIFTNAPFPSCHASTLAETKWGLVAAWFGGTRERDPDVCIYVSRNVKGHWTVPMEVANGTGFATNRLPCWNPVLFQPKSGPLLLFYKVGPSPATWWGMMTTSADGGQTWSLPQQLPDGILGPIKNKPVQLANGDILCPSSTEGKGGWRVHFERTGDLGRTWQATPPVNDGKEIGAIQPSILVHPDGKLQAVGRTRQGKIFQVRSDDNGRTWGPMTLLTLPNPDSGTDAVTLRDGRQLLVYNHNTRDQTNNKGRSPLNVAISDDGENWRMALVLENDPDAPNGFAYPAVIQTGDGLVHITYTWKRQYIKHVVIAPEKLKPQSGLPDGRSK
jgi:predicted neuraminidase/rhamnogalacturonyl hydrolase YesR